MNKIQFSFDSGATYTIINCGWQSILLWRTGLKSWYLHTLGDSFANMFAHFFVRLKHFNDKVGIELVDFSSLGQDATKREHSE